MNIEEFAKVQKGDSIVIPPRLEVRTVVAKIGENIVYAIDEQAYQDKYWNIVWCNGSYKPVGDSKKENHVLSPLQYELFLKLLEEKVTKDFIPESVSKKKKIHRIKALNDFRLYIEFSGTNKKSGVIPAYKIGGLPLQEWGQDIFDRAYVDRKDGALTWFVIHTSADGLIIDKKHYKVSPDQLWELVV